MLLPAAFVLLLVLFAPPSFAESALTATEIANRLAQNQDRVVELRKTFLYQQKARVRTG